MSSGQYPVRQVVCCLLSDNMLQLRPGARLASAATSWARTRPPCQASVRWSRCEIILTRYIHHHPILPSGYNQPTHQNDLPRPAGIASFMRLPVSTLSVSTRVHVPPQVPHCHVPRAGRGPAGRVHRGGPGGHGHLQQTRHQVWTQADQVGRSLMCLHYCCLRSRPGDPNVVC